MNTTETRELALDCATQWKKRPYCELAIRAANGDVEAWDVVAPSGRTYAVEVSAMWDDAPNENVRVIVAVSDSGWRSFFPMVEDFIVSPDGAYVGE